MPRQNEGYQVMRAENYTAPEFLSAPVRFSMNIGCAVIRCKYVFFLLEIYLSFTQVPLLHLHDEVFKKTKKKQNRFDCIQIGARQPVFR